MNSSVLRNVLEWTDPATPRSWYWKPGAINTAYQLGYLPIASATTSVQGQLVITVAAAYADLLRVGDEVTLIGGDSDFYASTGTNRRKVLAASGTSVTIDMASPTKNTISVTPTGMVAQCRFRHATILPQQSRTANNAATVFLGVSATDANNRYPVDPSMVTGISWNAVVGSSLTLAQIYGSTSNTADALWILFH